MEKILITGGAGFVGSNLADFILRNSDAEVVVYDNMSRAGVKKNVEWLKSRYSESGRLAFIKADVRDYSQLLKAAEDADVIYHTAAQVAVTTSVTNPKVDFEINALGTLNVLEVARLNNSVVITCSTNKVYGENVNKIPVVEKETRYEYADHNYRNGIPETFPIDLTGHSPYGCSKLTADTYTQDYAHIYGLKTAVLRMSCIYGERQFGVEDQGFLAHFVISAVLDKQITIYGTGKQVRDALYVADLVRALDLASKRAKLSPGEVYNIGGGPSNTLSLLEVIDYVEKISNKRIRLKFDEWRKADQRVYISDIRKAKKEFGWEPEIPWREGIMRLYRWVFDNRQLFTGT